MQQDSSLLNACMVVGFQLGYTVIFGSYASFLFVRTDLLKHDKLLSKKAPAHLRDVPEYLLDPTTQQASKFVKLTRAAMEKTNNNNCHRGSKGRSKKAGDPFKTFSAQAKGTKRKAKEFGPKQKKKQDV